MQKRFCEFVALYQIKSNLEQNRYGSSKWLIINVLKFFDMYGNILKILFKLSEEYLLNCICFLHFFVSFVFFKLKIYEYITFPQHMICKIFIKYGLYGLL